MSVFNEPTQWGSPLGNNADVNNIPDDTGASTGDVSFQKLWQVINQTPLNAGGKAPKRKDINALFKLIGASVFYSMNGGVPSYNPDYDYIVGRVILFTDGNLWKCIQPNTITVGSETVHVAPDSVDPVGTDYWKQLDGENNSTSLIPNQLIVSPVPLTDANLHLLDGALLSGSGAYSAYVDLIADLYNGGTASSSFCTEVEWQTSNTNYGFCNKFVYDSVANTVRLPKVNSEHGALIKSYSSGTSWYRIYQDGWCEQGGNVLPTTANSTWNLIKPFANTNYLIVGSDCEVNKVSENSFVAYSATQFSISTSVANYTKAWTACGYTDISDLQIAPIYEYIVVGTVTKTQIQIDIDNILADLALKADKEFSNVTNPVQVFKDMSIEWDRPDFSSVVTMSISSTEQTYTAPTDGFVCIDGASVTPQECRLYINDLIVASVNTTSTNYATTLNLFIPVSKGDICRFYGLYNIAMASSWFRFYPCKGVN